MGKRVNKEKETQRVAPTDYRKKIDRWFETLEPMNKTASVSQKLLAHIELKSFVKQFLLE